MNTRTPVAVISAERAEYSPEQNAWRTLRLRKALEQTGLSFASVQGRYQGKDECGYMIALLPYDEAFLVVCKLAIEWKQENILHVDASGYAQTFEPVSGKWESLGTLHAVPEALAARLNAYTKSDGVYYAAW